MNEQIKKSTCGAGTPSAETRKTFTAKRITQKPEKIKAVIQYPGQPASKVIEVSNNTKAICQLIECRCFATAKLPCGYIVIYDRDGHKLQKRLSVRIGTKSIPGIALVVAGSDKHFKSLSTADIQAVRGYLLNNFIYVE